MPQVAYYPMILTEVTPIASLLGQKKFYNIGHRLPVPVQIGVQM
jgi:hypothetical protein